MTYWIRCGNTFQDVGFFWAQAWRGLLNECGAAEEIGDKLGPMMNNWHQPPPRNESACSLMDDSPTKELPVAGVF